MLQNDSLTLRCVSRLLTYPDAAFFSRIPAVREEIERICGLANPVLHLFLDEAGEMGGTGLQEHYVRIFKPYTNGCLFLTWHKDGRAQAQAMTALQATYHASGRALAPGTAPDYAPLVLEFLAAAPEWAVLSVLERFGPELAGLCAYLERKDSLYAPPMAMALDVLSRERPGMLDPRPRACASLTRAPFSRPDASGQPRL